MRRVLLSLSLVVLVLLAASAFAQVPRLINYQGMLLVTTGQPISDGDYALTFSLYDEKNTQLWTETHNQVFVGAGLFQVMLGTVMPFNIPFDKPYFLGIQVGSDPELQPRMPLASVAYAIRAEEANRLFGYSVSPTPEPNTLLPLDASGKFPASVITGGTSGDFLKKNEPDTSRATCSSPLLLISNLGGGDGVSGRSTDGVGVAGQSTTNDGVTGWTEASGMSGVFGQSTDGRGVVGRSENDDGVVGWTGANDKSGMYGHSTDGIGVSGQSSSGVGVKGHSDNNDGVVGVTYVSGKSGVWGHSTEGYGVSGSSANSDGVVGWTENQNKAGVWGHSTDGTGVWGSSTNNVGLRATTESDQHAALAAGNEGAGPGLYVMGGSGGTAAIFKGNVELRSASTDAVVIELGEGLDYAEGFDFSSGSATGPGTVVIIDPEHPGCLAVSNRAYDRKVAGIVAGAMGLGSGVRLGNSHFDENVALAGRVYCNVDASYGEVEPGDLLTTSPTPGYAMVVRDYVKASGAILGKAMEHLSAGDKGQILVLVTLQ